jgi:hypothetical protein
MIGVSAVMEQPRANQANRHDNDRSLVRSDLDSQTKAMAYPKKTGRFHPENDDLATSWPQPKQEEQANGAGRS